MASLDELALYPFDTLRLAAGFLWVLMIFAWGAIVVSRLSCRPERQMALCFPAGLAVSVIVLFPFSLTGFSTVISWLWGITGIVLFFVLKIFDFSYLNDQAQKITGDPIATLTRNGNAILLTGLVVFLSSFVIMFRFQQFYDVLSYHLPLAHEIAAGSAFFVDPYDYYQALPFGAFLIYVPVLSATDGSLFDPGVSPIIWVAWLNCCFLAARLCGQFGAKKWIQNLAFLMIVLSPDMWKGMYNLQTDVLTALFALAAVERFVSGMKTGNRGTFLLSGILVASTYSIKQSALAIYIIPWMMMMGCYLISLLRSEKRSFQTISFAGIGLIAGMFPWLLRSTIIAGNPFFPLFGSHEFWTSAQQEFLLNQHQRVSPFSAEYFANLISNIRLFGYSIEVSTSGGIAILLPPIGLIAIAGVLLAGRRKFTLATVYLMVMAGYGALCLVGLAPLRFGLGLALIAVCLGLVVTSRIAGKYIAWAMLPIGLAIFSTVTVYTPIYMEGWRSVAWEPNRVFPLEVLESQHRIADASEQNQDSGSTWVLFEAKGRLFAGEVVSGKVWNPMPFADLIRASENESELRQKLIEQGIETIVVNDMELGRLVDFYGDTGEESNPDLWRRVGVLSPEEDYAARIAAYPPSGFAELSEKDCLLLARFLRQTLLQAESRLMLNRQEPDEYGRPVAFAGIWVTRLN